MNDGTKRPTAIWVVSVFLAAGSLIHSMNTARADARSIEVNATAAQRVHPVLIRNEHSALMRLTVQVKQQDVKATSFAFSLRGTDDKNDIESLQMFYTGDQGEFSPRSSFGDPAKPADNPTFCGNQKLQPGANVFWLSCRLDPTADLSHQVDAVCTSIRTSAGNVTPSDDTPGVRKRIGIALRKHNDGGVHTYRIPALATSPKGTLLCVYDMRRRTSRDLQEDIDIGLSRSTDGGRTWEPPRVIMDMGAYGGLPQEQNGCSDPGIIVDQSTGEIFCAAVWMWGKPGKHQWNEDGSEPGYEIGKTAQFLMVRSKDEGLTWTKPENMTRKLKKEEWVLFAPSPQQGITLRDGTLVMPSQGRDEKDRHFSTITISRDHGVTWTVGSPLAIGNTECQAAQLSDGAIMLNARTDGPTKFRSVYVTADLGKTWRQHETHRLALIEPNCNGSLYRLDYQDDGQPKHILLFANPHSREGRTHHTIQVSLDDGRTWPEKHKTLLDEGRGRGYPSISRIDDGHIGIVYEGSQADLVFERFSLEELLRR
jgi:sialidase-1